MKTALPIGSSNVDSDQYAFVQSSRARLVSHCLVDRTFVSKPPARVSKISRDLSRRELSIAQHCFQSKPFQLPFFYLGTTQNATRDCGPIDLSDGSIGGRGRNGLSALLKPRRKLFVVALNIRMLRQIDQQVAIAGVLPTFKVNVCCISETCVPHLSSIITLRSLDTTPFSPFTVRVSSEIRFRAFGSR